MQVRTASLWVAILTAIAAALPAQGKDVDVVQLRVSSDLGGGRIVIDRGDRDLIRKGDTVVIRPRGGTEYRGVIVDTKPRNALVQLKDKSHRPVPGTRGEVWIPKSRGTKPDPAATPDPTPEQPTDPKNPDAAKPEFRNQDPNWRPGMPLLGFGKPIRPGERPSRTTGRAFAIGRYADTDRDSDSDSFLRLGTALDVENPFGRGGRIHFDGEFDVRTEERDQRGEDLLLRGFSYSSGGTRFDDSRWEAGRFLQRGMPELQVIDGFEWGARRSNGHRYGASIGFMPEPDEDFESFRDFQIAAYYDWVIGEQEQLTISGAIQTTWHNGDSDRDLFLAKVRYLPDQGWRFLSTAWVDYYDSGEVAKNSGLELTQAFATLNRSYGDGNDIDFTYRRVRYPDILRNEFVRPIVQTLADKRYDRISATNWTSLSDTHRFRSELGYWNDEEDSGGNAEIGSEVRAVFTSGDRLDLTLFALLGQATTSGGGRVSYSVTGEQGSWLLRYEYGRHHFRGFPDDRDDLAQHYFRGSRSFFLDPGWDITIGAEAFRYDAELSWSVDFYLQKSF